MKLIVQPGNPLRGTVNVSGDKSLSHRAMLFAALAEGESHISNFLLSGVTRVMLEALGTLGIKWRIDGRELIIHGCGINGLKTPSLPINCGNSATTMRLLAGALAASGVPVVLDGSPGLRRRPMSRIVAPLRRMGVKIDTAEGGVAPLTIAGRDRAQSLIPLNETLPVASAQVKSCLLLAALSAAGESVIREPGPSRDHTERMLSSMGVCVEKFKVEERGTVSYETRIQPLRKPLSPLVMNLPGDISAAAFLIVAALITPGSEIYISGVGINPTRTGIIEALQKMGGDIRILNQSLQAGEPVGDIMVRFSPLSGIDVFGPLVVRMIDEFSVFGVAAAYANGKTNVRDASELRVKESDRILTLREELSKLKVDITEADDGFSVNGGNLPCGGMVRAHGDHRLAMALAVLGLGAKAKVCVEGAEIIHESFPEFVHCLKSLGADVSISGETLA